MNSVRKFRAVLSEWRVGPEQEVGLKKNVAVAQSVVWWNKHDL